MENDEIHSFEEWQQIDFQNQVKNARKLLTREEFEKEKNRMENPLFGVENVDGLQLCDRNSNAAGANVRYKSNNGREYFFRESWFSIDRQREKSFVICDSSGCDYEALNPPISNSKESFEDAVRWLEERRDRENRKYHKKSWLEKFLNI